MIIDVYEVRPRKDKCGVDLISRRAAIRSAVVWRAERRRERIGYAEHFSRSQNAVIRVYDAVLARELPG
jgi:hypothetical protein